MAFLKSVFLGYEGSYNVLGFPATFENSNPNSYTLGFRDPISMIANTLINNRVFQLITQGYAHVLIHETGHALAVRLFTGHAPHVHVYTSTCEGTCENNSAFGVYLDPWKKTIISVAGPMLDIAFSIAKLVLAVVFKAYLSLPIALILGGGAVIWISGELLYAFTSALKGDGGDFGSISQNGAGHLALASAALVAEVALGIFAAITLIA